MENKTTNTKAEEKEAFYRVLTDVYKQKYKLRTWLFKRILSHMLAKIKEESTIYFLMQNLQECKKHSV